MSGLGLDLGIRLGANGNNGPSNFADYAYAESSGPTIVTTLVAYGNTLAECPPLRTQNGAQYVVFWSTKSTKATSATYAETGLYLTSAGHSSSTTQYFSATTPSRPGSGMMVFTGDGTVKTIRLSGGSSAGNATFTESSIFVLKLGATDYASQGPANQTANSTTPVTMLTHTITPPSARDYLVIGYSSVGNGPTTSSPVLQVFDGATWEGGITAVAGGTSHHAPLFISRKVNVATSLAVELRKRTTSTTAHDFSYASFVALDLSRFTDAQATTLAAISTGSETTYTTAITQTFTPQAADYLFLATSHIQRSANNGLLFTKGTDGGTDLSEATSETGHMSNIIARKQTYTATSRTQTLQRKGDNATPVQTMQAGTSTIAAICLTGLTSA